MVKGGYQSKYAKRVIVHESKRRQKEEDEFLKRQRKKLTEVPRFRQLGEGAWATSKAPSSQIQNTPIDWYGVMRLDLGVNMAHTQSI